MIYSVDDAAINSSAASVLSPKVVYSEAFRRVFPFAHNKQLRNSYMEIIGSCNGFVCLSICYSRFWGENENTICVWNPSTGEYKAIPPARLLNHKTDQIGFCYDSNIHDYKVVKVRDRKIHGFDSVDVYALKSNSWTSVHQQNSYLFPIEERGSGFLFNGALHRKGFRITLNRVIVYFDINNKKLADFPFPKLDFPLKKIEREQSGALYDNLDTSVGILGGLLCLAIDVGKSRTDIWVMQDYGVNDSSTKLFSTLIYCSFMRPSLHLDNGEILMDTKVGLVMFDKKYERWRDLKVNTESVHALLLWDSSDAE
ncbi:F-box/kelch-repeat protein At3g06240-like [Papaver somniferum]|uniref:F-box/kelch-repeat protein At3g06240-like n=1 Tax=Papaver somniferum TaxID=3469 RepID=UPI000E6FB596|nr:F-box/kelch-repeat protein At3g06240-like [Papaver somniferum]